jgi:signal transduction histidine kinase
MVKARTAELRQVFKNLILNATANGGRLSGWVSTTEEARESCVTIADTGTGVPKRVRG